MSKEVKIKRALVSVFNKDQLGTLVKLMHENKIEIYSTGGTQKFIEELGIPVNAVEDVTSYPSILGGRVKTLHPGVFGGILNRRSHEGDQKEVQEYNIPSFDLVVVDLYPFEETLKHTNEHQEIIEKIDIGGISLIRAAAKNYEDVVVIPSMKQYPDLNQILKQGGVVKESQRKALAAEAFKISSSYDHLIAGYIGGESMRKQLRYGENPHQDGYFEGNFSELFDQLHGKELSYNNILDVDAAINLMKEFENEEPTFAILKHNNACGLASRDQLVDAYKAALAGDPVSAFGGILIANRTIDQATANEINELFCEVVIAPAYDDDALELLKSKKNRIILVQKPCELPEMIVRSALNGTLVQERDTKQETSLELQPVTELLPDKEETSDLIFANKIAKHTKSNTIVLAKNKQLLASGTGQTSRVDALKQAIHKAKSFNFDLKGAVMASDAFFPFPDCVEIAQNEGIEAVIQPGGSIKDQLSIDYCDQNEMKMVFTGIRHFKH